MFRHFYAMVPTADALELMKTELYANGFPTSYVGKIEDLAWSANDIYGSCKLVRGRLVGTCIIIISQTFLTAS